MLGESAFKSYIPNSTGSGVANLSCEILKLFKVVGLFGMVTRRKPLFSKKTMLALLKFIKVHPSKPQDFRRNVLWRDQ